jgi:hypothetical protein
VVSKLKLHDVLREVSAKHPQSVGVRRRRNSFAEP